MNVRPYIAVVTPMSRTRPARTEKDLDSSSGRPNSDTNSAPETLNRSVMVVVMDALSPYDSLVSVCNLRPNRLAGSTNTGSRINDSRVTCQDKLNMTPAVNNKPMTLDTTPDSVEVNACCAPT